MFRRLYGTRPGAANVGFARASRIIAGDVKDRSNNDIGDVEDLVVNLQDGKVRYVETWINNPASRSQQPPVRTRRPAR